MLIFLTYTDGTMLKHILLFPVFTQNHVFKPYPGWSFDVPSGAFAGPGALHRCLRHIPFSRGGHQAASSSPSTDAAITNSLAPPLTDPAKISLGWVPGNITAGESDLTQLSTADDLPHDPPPGAGQEPPLSPLSADPWLRHRADFSHYERHTETLAVLIFLFLITNDFEYHVIC